MGDMIPAPIASLILVFSTAAIGLVSASILGVVVFFIGVFMVEKVAAVAGYAPSGDAVLISAALMSTGFVMASAILSKQDNFSS